MAASKLWEHLLVLACSLHSTKSDPSLFVGGCMQVIRHPANCKFCYTHAQCECAIDKGG